MTVQYVKLCKERGKMFVLTMFCTVKRVFIALLYVSSASPAVVGETISKAQLPRCKISSCGGLLRPNVVWFHECLDPIVLGKAGIQCLLLHFLFLLYHIGKPLIFTLMKFFISLCILEKDVNSCDLCLVIGTSSVVYPAAMFAPQIAAKGVPVAEFNIEPTYATQHFRHVFII